MGALISDSQSAFIDKLFKYHPKCSKLKISHLFFADDLLLFYKADIYSIAKLKECLSEFSQVSGLETNPNKCSINMSGIGEDLKTHICSLLNFAKGRLQLIKSVILGIQNFWTNNYVLPTKVLKKIDSLCADFLWNHKIHLLSWKTICQSKEHGGLGVFSAKIWNTAAAIKLIWMIHLKKGLLWIKWVHGNYLRQFNIWQVQSKVNDSWMWKQIIRVRDKVICKLGDVSNVQNVISKCCSGSNFQISAFYHELINQNVNTQMVWSKTVWDEWSYPKHSFISWLAIHSRLLTKDRLCHMRILDINQHHRDCVLCTFQQQETCRHLFFDCAYSAELWNNVMVWLKYKWKSCNWDSIIDWYSSNLKGKGFMKRIKRMALTVSIYAIWKERNQRIFQQRTQDPATIFRRENPGILMFYTIYTFGK
ncbi:uncharacterized protein LOC109830852 [Asparagus officinalis]|uniref:uncharacterized protein LOC109830852 n=1 Tax=Asparagus officinalis TaxID=4686 RepID=UPI00098E6DA7|nr:uncharacterized protein LOC109830852 [Asparagus officinalis]